MTRTAYLGARLLDPSTGLDRVGTLLVDGTRIVGIGDQPPSEGVETIDCAGLCLAPGLVDMGVTVGEPGFEQKETIDTASRAAAAGGVTAFAMLPDTDPPIDDVFGIEFVERRAREVKGVKIFPYAAVTRGRKGQELTDFGRLTEAGALGFTDGTRPIGDALLMRRALSYARNFGALVMQLPLEPRLAEGGQMAEGETATRLGLAGIPAAAEAILLERDLRLLALTGGRYHASLVSTADGVALIRRAKQDGLAVTADTAPPYFALTEDAVGAYRTFAKLIPPLRSEADRRAVLAGLADGTIDAIGSDHAPQDQDNKRLPFDQAAFGGVGLETLLPLSLAMGREAGMGMLDMLARLTAAPARILGLPLGTLAEGAAADLVLFDPDAAWVVDSKALRSKSKNSPFDGMALTGRVVRTVVDGRTLFAA